MYPTDYLNHCHDLVLRAERHETATLDEIAAALDVIDRHADLTLIQGEPFDDHDLAMLRRQA